jgi:hypothetical protein
VGVSQQVIHRLYPENVVFLLNSTFLKSLEGFIPIVAELSVDSVFLKSLESKRVDIIGRVELEVKSGVVVRAKDRAKIEN